jgi:Tol biopolymer transport system component
MSLAQGTKLGPYEIVAQVGAGAMGEVYRARDGRLAREVAVKVLSGAFTRDPDRIRRFELEARAAGVLNHPNVLGIYDLGTHDGAPYLVAELLEGQTLRERLAAGALPPRKSIEYALQIAHGLAAAHEKGIVHRDLKPENVFVTKDGRVKILDFGLAKLTQPEALGDATAATMLAGTQPGVVLGTVGYMAPEQVRGRSADHRADIFSLGSILYEMLTGKAPFRGESAVEVMSAILTAEPPEVALESVPAPLAQVVLHCLEKAPEDRFQSARDLAFALNGLAGGFPSTMQSVRTLARAQSTRRRWRALGAAALVALALTLTGGAGFFAGGRAARDQVTGFQQLTFRRGTVVGARFAPDGQTVVYAAIWDGAPTEVYSIRLESPDSRSLGVPGAGVLAISPGSELLLSLNEHLASEGNWVRTGTLGRMGLIGGTPREVLEHVRQADFGPTGDILVVRDAGGKNRLEYPTGKVLYDTTGWVSHPRVSQSGSRIAFLRHAVRGDDAGDVAVVDGGTVRVLSQGWVSIQGLAWSAEGDEIWFTGTRSGAARALYAVDLRGHERLVARMPATLTLYDIARDGRCLLARNDLRTGIRFAAAGESQERDLSWLDWSRLAALSDDGKWVLFDEEGEGGGSREGVFLRKTDGSPAVRLGDGQALALSPDARQAIALSQPAPSQLSLFPTGAGEARALTTGISNHTDACFLPDGKRIAFAADDPGHGTRLHVVALPEGRPRPLTPEGIGFTHAASPDGKWIAARDGEGTVRLYATDGGSARPLPGLLEDELPIRFDKSGDAVYVMRRGTLPVQIFRVELPSGQRSLWKEIAPGDASGLVSVGQVLLTGDGKSYAYNYFRDLSALYVVSGLK